MKSKEVGMGKIGVAKRNITEGDVIATVNLGSGEVSSENIRFSPYGKRKVRRTSLFGADVKGG